MAHNIIVADTQIEKSLSDTQEVINILFDELTHVTGSETMSDQDKANAVVDFAETILKATELQNRLRKE